MKFNIILITDSSYGISKHNKMPWNFPVDLKFFNKITLNNVCIMGSTTAKDLGKPLRDRVNIVISSEELDQLRKDYSDNDFIITRSFEEALKEANKQCYRSDKEIFIIGGSRLYNETLQSPNLDKIYYTHINKSFGCDNFIKYPLLELDNCKYEVLDKVKIDKLELLDRIEIMTNVELTFYLITKK